MLTRRLEVIQHQHSTKKNNEPGNSDSYTPLFAPVHLFLLGLNHSFIEFLPSILLSSILGTHWPLSATTTASQSLLHVTLLLLSWHDTWPTWPRRHRVAWDQGSVKSSLLRYNRDWSRCPYQILMFLSDSDVLLISSSNSDIFIKFWCLHQILMFFWYLHQILMFPLIFYQILMCLCIYLVFSHASYHSI